MRYVFIMLVYSILGYLLERLINLIFLGYWLDNRVFTLFYQPMYGIGVVLTLIVYERVFHKRLSGRLTFLLFVLSAIVITGIVEFLSGNLYAYLYGVQLWDYGHTFSMCRYPYVCVIPTSLFGLISAFVILYIHPHIEIILNRLPNWVKWGIIGVFVIDGLMLLIGGFTG